MNRWKSIGSIGFIFIACIMIVSCVNDNSINNTGDKNMSITAEQALALWRSKEIHDYSFSQTRSCNWYPWCNDTMRIIVKSDTIYSITPISAKSSTSWGMSVDELFNIAQSGNSQYLITAEYDGTYGFPKLLILQSKPPFYTEGSFVYITFNFEK